MKLSFTLFLLSAAPPASGKLRGAAPALVEQPPLETVEDEEEDRDLQYFYPINYRHPTYMYRQPQYTYQRPTYTYQRYTYQQPTYTYQQPASYPSGTYSYLNRQLVWNPPRTTTTTTSGGGTKGRGVKTSSRGPGGRGGRGTPGRGANTSGRGPGRGTKGRGGPAGRGGPGRGGLGGRGGGKM